MSWLFATLAVAMLATFAFSEITKTSRLNPDNGGFLFVFAVSTAAAVYLRLYGF